MNVSRVGPWVLVSLAACLIGCHGETTVGLCAEGLTSCDGACVDTRTSTAHCGACGTACGPDQVCTDSACTGQCGPSLSLCGGVCTDLATDADHCGSCDNVCDDGLVCVDRVCRVACPGNLTRCGDLCVDTVNDPDHCGTCELQCPLGYECAGGACGLACGLTTCGGQCVDTAVDPAHCGGCDVQCLPGYGCAGGQCILTCDGTDCDGACVDTTVDPAHCGGCGHACVVGEICVGGDCVVSCGPWAQECNGICVDTTIDPAHCGACNHTCPPGQVCSAGACALSCAGGTTRCGDACVDTDVDPSHCGACDDPCPPGQICLSGACTPCLPGMELCSGVCRSTDSDTANCGACGHACSYVSYGNPVCTAGVCSVQCYSGRSDCDGNGTSCESYLASDRNNCGSCGTVCPANHYCSGGTCQQCAAGKTLCGSTESSCEDLMTDIYNCGACDVYCLYGPSHTERYCAAGVCQYRCNAGYIDCDLDPGNGCEVAVSSDRANCGTCGIVCSQDQTCTSGLCQSCPPGRSVCGNSCVDLTTSSSNCGACGHACVSSLPHSTVACVASTCAFTCATGYLDCDGDPLDGCETALGPGHCGACGLNCAASEFCAKTWSCVTCLPLDLGSTIPQTVTGTTVGHSDLFDSTCGYGNAPDVHYSFTAPVAGAYTFDTIGSSFDTVLEVRDGQCDGPRLSCNNDGGGAYTSRLTVTLAKDQVVIVIVDGRSSSQGAYVLNVQ